MNRWEKFLDVCIREIAKEELVLDIGSAHPFQKELNRYKPMFTAARYYSLDNDISCQPNIVGDIHNLPFKDGSADAIICKAVLEHVPEPLRAVSQMHRVLRKSGRIFAYAPFLCGYHGGKSYKDYYRFTKDGIEYMFREFAKVRIVEIRGYLGTLCVFVPILRWLAPVANLLDKFMGYRVTSGYYIFAMK